MGAPILRQLKKDQQELKDALSEQEEILANAQATILRIEGAIVYLTKFIEHIEEAKEDKKDASSSG